MREKTLRLYFPALIPRYRHAEKWRCLKGYNAFPAVSEKGEIKAVCYRFKARNAGARGKRVLFFSDFHYTPQESLLADELCSLISRLKADLLLCGGDLCSDAVFIKDLPPLLDKLSQCAPLCAAVPGNWERGKTWLAPHFWHDMFQKHNWHYLCNDALDAGSWGWIYGCDDISRGYPGLLRTSPEDRENIFLVHRPDTVIAVDRETPLDDFTFSICGHTHGGQIRVPFLGALTVPSFYGRRMACGLYAKKESDTRMLISTGVNHASFPWRINCRREILLIEFE